MGNDLDLSFWGKFQLSFRGSMSGPVRCNWFDFWPWADQHILNPCLGVPYIWWVTGVVGLIEVDFVEDGMVDFDGVFSLS